MTQVTSDWSSVKEPVVSVFEPVELPTSVPLLGFADVQVISVAFVASPPAPALFTGIFANELKLTETVDSGVLPKLTAVSDVSPRFTVTSCPLAPSLGFHPEEMVTVTPVAVVVAACDITTVVPLVTDEIVVPEGMPAPETALPTSALVNAAVAELSVVVLLSTPFVTVRGWPSSMIL